MTTEQWELAERPSRYDDYNWYSDDIPARKFYLFLAEIGRRLRHLMTDPGPITMIDLCERCAEGKITEDELSDLSDEHRPGAADGPYPVDVANHLYFWVADRYKVSTRGVYYAPDVFAFPAAVEAGFLPPQANSEQVEAVREHPVFTAARAGTELEWGALVRDIYGPSPFRPPTCAPRWRTADALGLARGIYEGSAFDRLPILADALMDVEQLRARGAFLTGEGPAWWQQ
jgi:hypothetical protein